MEATTQKTEPRHIQSRVGKRPIIVPKGVTAALKDGAVKIEGPKGKLSRTIPAGVDVKIDGGKVTVTSNLGGPDGSRLQGLVRAPLPPQGKGGPRCPPDTPTPPGPRLPPAT